MTAEELLDKGMDYLHGFGGVDEDYEQAINYFVEAKEAGNIKAMDKIGFMYQYGYGVTKNKSEAVKWYRRGAELGDADSMNSLADCLLKGIGTDKDVDEAIQWYRRAVELGNYNQVKELATCLIRYQDNESEAFEWLKKSASNYSLIDILMHDKETDAETSALKELAEIYYFSMSDTQENKLKAFELYRKLAEENPRYGYDVAVMYWEGKGVEKNLSEALKWIRSSAEAGSSQSMSELAEIYLKGELVPEDERKALEWLRKYFEKNSMMYKENDEDFDAEIAAMYSLANIYYADENYSPNCDKSLEDKKRAFELFQELDKRGFKDAKYRIARMYEYGEYVSQDKLKALEIYEGNAEKDSACCHKVIEIYLEEGNIPKAVEFIVKYFNTAEEQFCRCALCSPFQETKKVAKYFIDTPNEEIIKLYDNDRKKAAQAVLDFGHACYESPVNVSIHLEMISIVADIMESDCSRKILEYLVEFYEKIYEDAVKEGVPDSVEGDAVENLLGRLTESLSEYAEENEEDYEEGSVSVEYTGEKIEFEHHDANYYKMRSVHYQLKLASYDRKVEDIKKVADFFGKRLDEVVKIYDGAVQQVFDDISLLADIYKQLSSSEKNPKQKNKYKQKYQKWQRKAKEVLNRSVYK